MAAIDFPTATSNGQTFEADSGVIYTYVGTPPNGFWSGTFGTTGLTTLDGRYIAKNDTNTIQTIQTQGLKFNNGSADTILIDGLNSRIGIGTITTSGASTYYDDLVINNTASGTGSGITLLANATNGLSAIDFGDTDAIGRGRITYNHAVDNLIIDVAGTEAARIDNSGNIGIGTNSPSGLLHLKGGGIRIQSDDNTDEKFIEFRNAVDGSTRGFVGYSFSDDALKFRAGGSGEKMRIDSSGNVGIGASSITNLSGYAQLALNDSNGGFIDILDDGVNQARIIGSGNELTLRAPNTGGEISFDTDGNSERMRIDSSGRVGVGTSSPQTPLHVVGNSILAGNVSVGTTASNAYLQFPAATGWGPRIQQGGASINDFGIFTNNTEHLTVKSSGKVGIGTTSPASLLHVEGTGATVEARIRNNTSTATQKAALYLTTSTVSTFNSAGIEAIRNTGSTDELAFIQGDTEKARIDGSGRLLVGTSSAFDVGTSGGYTPSFQLAGDSSEEASVLARNSDGTALFVTADGGGGSAVSNNDTIGSLNFKGYDGDSYPDFAHIRCQVDGTVSDQDCPGRLVFSTNPGSPATGPTERMRISSDGETELTGAAAPGAVNYGTIVDGVCLTVNGTNATSSNAFILIGNERYANFGATDCGFIFAPSSSNNNFYPRMLQSCHRGASTTSEARMRWYQLQQNTTTERALYEMNSGAFQPMVDNAYDLGTSGSRFDDVYATNGTIQTSDVSLKEQITDLSSAELQAAMACKSLIRKYKWISAVEEKGEKARWHIGVIAQDVQQVFDEAGLNADDYGLFVRERYWSYIDANNNNTITSDQDEADLIEDAVEHTRLAIRYSELLAFIIAAI